MKRKQTQAADFFEMSVVWEDSTAFGSTLSGNAQEFVRRSLYPLTTRKLLQAANASSRARQLLSALKLKEYVLRDRQSRIYKETTEKGEFWHPEESKVSPALLYLTSTFNKITLKLALNGCQISHLRTAVQSDRSDRPWVLQHILELASRQVEFIGFTRVRPRKSYRDDPLFVGHACLTWSDGDVRIWSDPFLRPKNPRYPISYQPLSPYDFPEDNHVVVLTHTHPDHFDPGSLLSFPDDTLFIIPEIKVESILTVNVRLRLKQLGFKRIRSLNWWEEKTVGSFVIQALPFYGEQPLAGETEVSLSDYNFGNTYAIRNRKGFVALILADSGSDPRMSTHQFARALKKELGRVTYVFANHRRWRLYPPQYLLTSVPQFLCYVPDHELSIPQQIMMEPYELAKLAEILEARFVAPYAMGGARWHQEIGLGYDYLNPKQRSTSFDANPRELHQIEDGEAGLQVNRTFSPVVLFPGQSLTSNGKSILVHGLRLPCPTEFKPAEKERTPNVFTLVGREVTPSFLRDLLHVMLLDQRAFFLSAPEFCEVYTPSGNSGALLCAILAEISSSIGTVITQYEYGLSAQPFSSDPVWFSLFRRTHNEVFAQLKRNGDLIKVLRALAESGIFSSLPSELLERIHYSFLGYELVLKSARFQKSTPVESAIEKRLQDRTIQLSASAEGIVKEFGATKAGIGLLLIKLIHNFFLTCSSLELPMHPRDEEEWFLSILAPSPHNLSERIGK